MERLLFSSSAETLKVCGSTKKSDGMTTDGYVILSVEIFLIYHCNL